MYQWSHFVDIIEENRPHFEIDTENLEKAWQDVKEGKVQETSWASSAPEIEIDRIESNGENCWSTGRSKNIPELRFQKQTSEKHSFHYESPKFPQKEIAQDLRKMNNIQQDLFYYIKHWCLKLLWNKKPEPFSIFLTGGAGTGKSHIIRCIYHEATRIWSKVSNTLDYVSVLLTAPTGTAAFNIQGMTVHAAFAINKNATLPYQPLEENLLNSLKNKLQTL